MKPRIAFYLCASFIGLALSARSQDDIDPDSGPFYQVERKAMAGDRTVSRFTMEGKAPHSMMERTYDDGTLFRYFLGPEVSAFTIFDNRALEAMPDGAPPPPASHWFSGLKDGDTPPVKATATTENGLTNEQDAMVRIDLEPGTDFLATMVEAGALNLKIGEYTGKFDLKGSRNAADALLTAADSPEGEKVILDADHRSVVWDLSLPAGESKVYQIQGKKGQKMKLGFIEDSGEGQVDLGKASVEEGQEGAAIHFEKDRLQRVDVSNPSGKVMEFRIFLSVE